ncbi:MAG: hypothetical protein Q9221_008952 [Calogaya cf. arnoldii]
MNSAIPHLQFPTGFQLILTPFQLIPTNKPTKLHLYEHQDLRTLVFAIVEARTRTRNTSIEPGIKRGHINTINEEFWVLVKKLTAFISNAEWSGLPKDIDANGLGDAFTEAWNVWKERDTQARTVWKKKDTLDTAGRKEELEKAGKQAELEKVEEKQEPKERLRDARGRFCKKD